MNGLRSLLWKGTAALAGAPLSPAGLDARLSILVYHGVGPEGAGFGHWEVDAGRFETHLRVLRDAFNVLHLEEAVSRLADGTLPARAACITMDDGYANNATIALPILERHALPATFFIATAYLDGGRMFNDAIIEAVQRCESAELVLEGLDLGRHDLTAPGARARTVAYLLHNVRGLAPDERRDRTHAIVEATGVELRSRLMMTREQVADLVRAGMDVGGHTDSHPLLNSVPDAVAVEEIRKGKQALEDIVGRPVDLFAYPNGHPGRDYSLRHVAMVRDAGFKAGVTTGRGVAARGCDIFQLPRFTPWDRSAEGFLARMLLNCRHRGVVATA